MKKHIIFILIFLMPFIYINVYAIEDKYDYRFEKIDKDHAQSEYNDLIRVSDGLILIGNFNNNSSKDSYIIKTDEKGNTKWHTEITGDKDDVLNSIIAVDDGFIVVGYSASTNLNELKNNGGSDAIIIKYDYNGNKKWQKNFGGNAEDVYTNITKVSDGLLVTGYTSSTNIDNFTHGSYEDAILIKYDNNGNVVWRKNIAGNWGDFFYDSIEVDDGYIVTGTSASTTVGYNANGLDGLIVKYDKKGNQVWKKVWGDEGKDTFYKIAKMKDGFAVVGFTFSKKVGDLSITFPEDGVIVKYDFSGTVKWQKNYFVEGTGGDEFLDLSVVDNDVIVSGYSWSNNITGLTYKGRGDAILLRYNGENGDIVWQKNWGGGGEDVFKAIFVNQREIFAVGYSDSNDLIDKKTEEKNSIIVKYSYPEYQITVNKLTGGIINLSKTTAYEGDKITLNPAANKGYVLSKLLVKDENGNEIKIANNEFTMPESNVTVDGQFKALEIPKDDETKNIKNPETSIDFEKKVAYTIILLVTLFYIINLLKKYYNNKIPLK